MKDEFVSLKHRTMGWVVTLGLFSAALGLTGHTLSKKTDEDPNPTRVESYQPKTFPVKLDKVCRLVRQNYDESNIETRMEWEDEIYQKTITLPSDTTYADGIAIGWEKAPGAELPTIEVFFYLADKKDENGKRTSNLSITKKPTKLENGFTIEDYGVDGFQKPGTNPKNGLSKERQSDSLSVYGPGSGDSSIGLAHLLTTELGDAQLKEANNQYEGLLDRVLKSGELEKDNRPRPTPTPGLGNLIY